MVEISPVLPIWLQLGSLFFVLSGISADLLLIRLLLFLGYVFLFLNAVLGGPLWPDLSWPGHIAVNSLVWACLGLYIHGADAIALILDELPVKLSEDEEALWRLFYRSGGLSKKLFKTLVAPRFLVEDFEPGGCIESDTHFNILYKGLVTLNVLDNESDGFLSTRTVFSGEMFDCRDLQQFAEGGFFTKHRVKAVSRSSAKVFRISIDDMKEIANQPFAKGVIQTMLIDAMESIVEDYHNGGRKPVPVTVQEMEKELSEREEKKNSVHSSNETFNSFTCAEYIAPSFRPLEEWELPPPWDAGSCVAWKRPLEHLVKYFFAFLGPPPPFAGHPVGIRHTLLQAPSRLPKKNQENGGNRK